MDDEIGSDWTISFNTGAGSAVDEDDILSACAPYVVEAARKEHDRFELVLNDELPDMPDMSQVAWQAMCRLSALCPNGFVVGHVDDEEAT